LRENDLAATATGALAGLRASSTIKIPPSVSALAAKSRSVGRSPSHATPAEAASTGTASCTIDALVAEWPGSAAYHAT
jgi:hypothetical protein